MEVDHIITPRSRLMDLIGWGCGTAHWLAKCPHHAEEDHIQGCCAWLFEECRVKCNEPNNHGQTPLHKAAFEGNLPMLKYLVRDRGIMDTLTDHQGNTAADCAERNSRGAVAIWIRRYASPIRQKAMDVLNRDVGPQTCGGRMTIPSLSALRRLYLQKSKDVHPDRRRVSRDGASEPMPELSWTELQQAYELLVNWWRHPELYDLKVRMDSRNAALLDRPALLWFREWHLPGPSSMVISPTHSSATSELSIFERRLLSLLLTDAYRERGLRLAQLPKEFQKCWSSLPKPKEHGCRKWIDLIQRKLSNTVYVEKDPSGMKSPIVFAKVGMAERAIK